MPAACGPVPEFAPAPPSAARPCGRTRRSWRSRRGGIFWRVRSDFFFDFGVSNHHSLSTSINTWFSYALFGSWKPRAIDVEKRQVDENPRSGSKSRAGAAVPPAVKKALEEDDDDGFDVNFDLKTDFSKVNLNAVDPWRRAVSA